MPASITVRAAEVASQPWRNGGGVTRPLLVWPRGDAWQVRVSVADVAANGPFSRFPGVQRWFAVLDGAGVVLTIGSTEHRLDAGSDAFSFRGDVAVRCRLVDGPTRDLNLMLNGVPGSMRRVVAGEAWRPEARECGLFAITAGDVRCDGARRARADACAGLALVVAGAGVARLRGRRLVAQRRREGGCCHDDATWRSRVDAAAAPR